MRDIKLSDLVKKEKDLYKCRWLGFDGVDQDIKIVENTERYIEHRDKELSYYEDSEGYWWKKELKKGHKKDGEIYYEGSDGYKWQSKYRNGVEVSYEDSGGNWKKIENGKKIEYTEGRYFVDNIEHELKN